MHTLTMADELLTERVQIVTSPSQVKAIDEWRRQQEKLPSRSEAIRELIDRGLQSNPD